MRRMDILYKNLLNKDLINQCLSTIKKLPPKVLVPLAKKHGDLAV